MHETREKTSLAMQSKDGEWVDFVTPCELNGQVEAWLNRLMSKQCETIFYWLKNAVTTYSARSREQWIMKYPAQIAVAGSKIWWTSEVNGMFLRLEAGYETALKDYNKKQMNQLNALITKLLGDLSKGDRQKIMNMCIIDVHARDIVSKMIAQKVGH
jgi:dynein heavy chain, axonemal